MTISIIMQLVRTDPSRLTLKTSQVRLLVIAAKNNAPTTPSAPASVGVATPMYMLPSTKRIRMKTGAMAGRALNRSFQL